MQHKVEIIEPKLAEGWKNYGRSSGSGLTYEKARFYKDCCGTVHCEGLVKGTATQKYFPMFVLPQGYRPKAAHQFRTFCCYGEQIFVYVAPDGRVMVKAQKSYSSVNLGCISFLAEH